MDWNDKIIGKLGMEPKDQEPVLGESKQIATARVTVSVLGGIPGIGPVIQAALLEAIPNVRSCRIEAYLLYLNDKIDKVALKRALDVPEGLDTFEEGLWQSTRAFTKERQTYIANLVAEGLQPTELNQHKVRHFLRILNQIDDRQIILLTQFHPKYSPATNSTQARHFAESQKEIVNPSWSITDMFDYQGREKAEDAIQLNASMVGHLASLGVLEADGNFDNTGMPLTTRKFYINNFGKDFLNFIGVCK